MSLRLWSSRLPAPRACSLRLRSLRASGFLPLLFALMLAAAPGFAESPAEPAGDFGVLLLSHGGSPEWNATVAETVRPLRERWRVEIAFGMADASTMEQAVRRLEDAGVRRIGVVRLFVWGESFLDRTRQVLGLLPGAPPRPADPDAAKAHAAEHPHGQGPERLHGANELQAHLEGIPFWRIETRSRCVVSSEGLAQCDTMGEVLAERVRGLSRDPARESVLLLGHGPEDDAENERWLAALAALGDMVGKGAPYRALRVETLREDWPDKRAAAIERIRSFVKEAGRDGGRALVVPVRIQGFGPYAQVLEGLDYDSDGKGLTPHANVSRWLAEQAERLERELDDQEN